MNLGTFSLSLAVKDLAASRAFYETLGFSAFDGDGEAWLMLENGAAKIGLFQGMFDSNIVTFNPPDARAIEAAMVAAGSDVVAATEGDSGPTSFVVLDPDGNQLLFDQHTD